MYFPPPPKDESDKDAKAPPPSRPRRQRAAWEYIGFGLFIVALGMVLTYWNPEDNPVRIAFPFGFAALFGGIAGLFFPDAIKRIGNTLTHNPTPKPTGYTISYSLVLVGFLLGCCAAYRPELLLNLFGLR